MGGVPSEYCATIWADNLKNPRKIAFAENGDLVLGGGGQVIVLWDDDKDGTSSESERAVLATGNSIGTDVVIHKGFLYSTSSTHVYRWEYPKGQRSELGLRQTVIEGLPSGGHTSRTLAFDSIGRLYVSVGSGTNVDEDASRSAIFRYNPPFDVPQTWGIDGETFASGLRNEVGIAFDKDWQLWGVENGVDKLDREPWGDIHKDNPAEEFNFLGSENTTAGLFYGYPYCWSEYLLEGGKGPKTQWAQKTNDPIHTDEWCQNTSNVIPPAFVMPAHVAPLDLIFYYGSSLPGIKSGDAIVSWHGSWNRDPPQGYKVVHVSFHEGKPIRWEPFFYYIGQNGVVNGKTGSDTGKDWPHRPVGLAVGPCSLGRGECLYITSDASGKIIVMSVK